MGIHFIRKLRELKPDLIISQPVYGFPQVQAETDVINASWDSKGTSANLADSIGLMVLCRHPSTELCGQLCQWWRKMERLPHHCQRSKEYHPARSHGTVKLQGHPING